MYLCTILQWIQGDIACLLGSCLSFLKELNYIFPQVHCSRVTHEQSFLVLFSSALHIWINFALANSSLLLIRNFYGKWYTEIHVLKIDVIIVSRFLLAMNTDANNWVQGLTRWSRIFPLYDLRSIGIVSLSWVDIGKWRTDLGVAFLCSL